MKSTDLTVLSNKQVGKLTTEQLAALTTKQMGGLIAGCSWLNLAVAGLQKNFTTLSPLTKSADAHNKPMFQPSKQPEDLQQVERSWQTVDHAVEECGKICDITEFAKALANHAEFDRPIIWEGTIQPRKSPFFLSVPVAVTWSRRCHTDNDQAEAISVASQPLPSSAHRAYRPIVGF